MMNRRNTVGRAYIVERSEEPLLPFSQLEVVLKKPVGKGYVKNPQTIGNHIRNKRLERKLTQKGLADKLGVHHSSVLHWEAGTKEPNVKQLPLIIQFLGYEPVCLKKAKGGKTVHSK